MSCESLFYNPFNYGCFSIASSQNEDISIDFDQPVLAPKIVSFAGNVVLKEYTETEGITVSADRHNVVFNVNGEDFKDYENGDVNFEMSFFRDGVVEFLMTFKIIKSNL